MASPWPATVSPTDIWEFDPSVPSHNDSDRVWSKPVNLDYFDPNRDKFFRYDSSPGGTSSLSSNDDDEILFELNYDDSESHRSKTPLALSIVRESIRPAFDLLHSVVFPFALDNFREDLVLCYLTDYPQAAYGFSPHLKPHPMALTCSVALTNPACFQSVLARSAFHRISTGNFTSEVEKNDLELAVIHHKGEALKDLRSMSRKANKGARTEELLASIMSLGTLDRRTGAEDAALMHSLAARRLLTSIGGPEKVESIALSRTMVHFECICGTTPFSYVWDQSDLSQLLTDLNSFFARIFTFWKALARRNKTMQSTGQVQPLQPLHSLGLQQGSVLVESLNTIARDTNNLTQIDRSELIAQLTSLLTLCTVVLDQKDDPASLEQYMLSLHNLVDQADIRGQSHNNALWLLQVNDHTDAHTRRTWQAASWIWVLKHVSYNVQGMIKEWLLAFLLGKPLGKTFKLSAFHFSYAS